MLPTNVKGILLDVDGTLFDHSPVRRAMMLNMLRYYARRPFSGWQVLRALTAYRAAQEQLRAGSGNANPAEAQLYLACQRSNLPPEFVRQVVERWMEREPLVVLPAAVRPRLPEFLAVARRKGIRLAVCSDYPPQAKLEAMGIAACFDAVICAQDASVGRFKPDPKMLHVALEQLGLQPQQVVYLGDRAEVDGKAAVAAGIPFILINRATGFSELLDRWEEGSSS